MTRNSKNCIQCGAPLPEEATFCPRCATFQLQRHTVSEIPAGRRQWLAVILCALLALALPVGAALLHGAPEQTVETPAVLSAEDEDRAARYGRECQTYYEGADGRLYHIFTAFSPGIDGSSALCGYQSRLLAPGAADTGPLTLYVEGADNGEDARADFSKLLADWTVAVTAPEGGECCSLYEPIFDYATAMDALLYREMAGTSACRYNEITWTLAMKNGDTVTLRQAVEYAAQTEVTYRWENTPMETAAQLQALLDDIAADSSETEAISLYLPSVTYDAPLTVRCAMTLYGHEDGTVLAAPVTVTAASGGERISPRLVLDGLTFSGEGGVGLDAYAPVCLKNCRFSGWDIAAQANDGGWLFCEEDVRFDRNGVAMRLDSTFSTSCGSNINNTAFTRNGIALQIARIPGERAGLILERCAFWGNEADIENPNDYPVELRNSSGIG